MQRLDRTASYEICTPEDEKSPAQLATEVKRNALTISSDWNTYRVVHAGSAA